MMLSLPLETEVVVLPIQAEGPLSQVRHSRSLTILAAATRLTDIRRTGCKAGLRAGDLLVRANGAGITSAQSLQRLMLGDAIGKPLALTLLRSEALLDVTARPKNCVATHDPKAGHLRCSSNQADWMTKLG